MNREEDKKRNSYQYIGIIPVGGDGRLESIYQYKIVNNLKIKSIALNKYISKTRMLIIN